MSVRPLVLLISYKFLVGLRVKISSGRHLPVGISRLITAPNVFIRNEIAGKNKKLTNKITRTNSIAFLLVSAMLIFYTIYMDVKIGCDIVSVARFEQSAKEGGKEFLNKIFSSSELAFAERIETLAGMFAAKESVMKALGLKAGDWQKIEIRKNSNGRPVVKILDSSKKILSQDISISHDGEYAMAVAIFYLCY